MQKRKEIIQRQKRPASIADRAVIVSYGVLFGAIPCVFGLIASPLRGDHQLPWTVYAFFGLVGLCCIRLAFAPDVNVSPPSRVKQLTARR